MERGGIEKQNPMLEICGVVLHLHISTKMDPICMNYAPYIRFWLTMFDFVSKVA
jgi:hypothetical protein